MSQSYEIDFLCSDKQDIDAQSSRFEEVDSQEEDSNQLLTSKSTHGTGNEVCEVSEVSEVSAGTEVKYYGLEKINKSLLKTAKVSEDAEVSEDAKVSEVVKVTEVAEVARAISKSSILNIIKNVFINDLSGSKDFLWALALKSWYLNEKDISLMTGQLILNLYPSHELLAHNIKYYTMPLQYKEMLIADEAHEKYYLPMNTSLSTFGDKKYVGFVRCVSYLIINGIYVTSLPDNTFGSITWMYIFEKKDKLELTKKIRIAGQNETWKNDMNGIHSGSYEDLRVYPQMIGENEWLFSACKPISEGTKQFVGRIKYDGKDTVEMFDYNKIDYGNKHEKNWVISNYNPNTGKATIIYQWYPLTILKYDTNNASYEVRIKPSNNKMFKYDYKGGSSPINVKNRIIAVVHEWISFERRYYINRFIEVNLQHEIIGISDAFKLNVNHRIEYVSGLMANETDNEIYMTMGINDKELRVLTLDIDYVLNLISSEETRIKRFYDCL